MSAIRVLLVDDEKLVLSSLRRLLMRESFEVMVAESGPDALGLLEHGEVDLVVSDYKMPGMNGVEFLEQVRVRWPDIRRCMLTAQADRETLDRALQAGTVQVAFRKPWDNRDLIESLRAAAAGPALA
jgi:two-component system NtrC family sensor kinase